MVVSYKSSKTENSISNFQMHNKFLLGLENVLLVLPWEYKAASGLQCFCWIIGHDLMKNPRAEPKKKGGGVVAKTKFLHMNNKWDLSLFIKQDISEWQIVDSFFWIFLNSKVNV